MTSENMIHASSLCLFNNRHSPRISNKNARKLDISSVHNKIDFMKALNLCIKTSYAKADWEVLSPKNSIPLKKCSVVINSVVCNYCKQSLKTQKDINYHRSLHRQFENIIPVFRERNKDTKCADELKDYNVIELNNNETMKNKNKIEPSEKIIHRKRNKKSVTKLTLRIGKEIITKVYCKRKYLNQCSAKVQSNSTSHNSKNGENSNEIYARSESTKPITNATDISLAQEQKCTNDISNREARIREMASLLVEYEIERKALQDLNNSRSFERNFIKLCEDAAVVPKLNDVIDSNTEDDDIQEIQCENKIHKNDIVMSRYTEIITIDDELSENSDDDCIIIDEELCTKNSLAIEEASYIFYVTNKEIAITDTADSQKNNNFSQKRKSLSNSTHNFILKKQKIENANKQCNVNISKEEKENRNYQIPTVNQIPYQ